MRRAFLLVAFAACAAFGADRKPECTLMVSPRGGDSSVSKSGGLIRTTGGGSSSNNGTKTITRNMKWLAEVRIRENRPKKLELKAYYIGEGDGGKSIKQIGTEAKTLELDRNGRASVELTSPTTRLTKTRTTNSSGGSGFRSTRKSVSGDRVTGCVIQVFGDGELVRSWSSDPRWTPAANKAPFSIAELARKRSGAIGQR